MRIICFLVLTAIAAATASAQSFEKRPDKFTAQSLVEALDSGHGIAGSSSIRQPDKLALTMLKDFEGWEPRPYLDSSDYCTVGYGHLIAKKHCKDIDPLPFSDGLTQTEGDALLDEDTLTARVGVTELVEVDLSDCQFGALTNFVFNIGVENFRKSTILRLINYEEHEAAAEQFGRWIRSGDDTPPGLVTRRACEAALYRGELSLDANGVFDRKDCASGSGIASYAGEPIDIVAGEKSGEVDEAE